MIVLMVTMGGMILMLVNIIVVGTGLSMLSVFPVNEESALKQVGTSRTGS